MLSTHLSNAICLIEHSDHKGFENGVYKHIAFIPRCQRKMRIESIYTKKKLLFIIWFINLFLYIIKGYKNLKFKYLIDNITINIWYSWNFLSMEDIIKKMQSINRFTKIYINKKIYEEFEEPSNWVFFYLLK